MPRETRTGSVGLCSRSHAKIARDALTLMQNAAPSRCCEQDLGIDLEVFLVTFSPAQYLMFLFTGNAPRTPPLTITCFRVGWFDSGSMLLSQTQICHHAGRNRRTNHVSMAIVDPHSTGPSVSNVSPSFHGFWFPFSLIAWDSCAWLGSRLLVQAVATTA